MRKFSLFTLPLFCGAMLAAGAIGAQTVASGTTGRCTWTLTGTSGNYTLTISGTGAMGGYSYSGNSSTAPWCSGSYRNSIKALSIGQGVTSIGSHAFAYCSGLTSVTIPASVTEIGNFAFAYCGGLTSVTIPASVTFISDNGVFYNCSSLTSINVDDANASYASEDGVLFNKRKTTLICCPAGKIGSYTIPAGVTEIGDDAFEHCYGLTSVTIPAGVTAIGYDAFSDCSGLTSVTIPASVMEIGDFAFADCSGLTSVTIPASVTEIGSYAFFGCSGLTSVTIPASVTEIGDDAFYGCSGLTFVTIPASVTSIGSHAFSYCGGLTSVTIPASVTSIGNFAFAYCGGLTSVTNLRLTPQSISSNVFTNVNKTNCTLRVRASAVEAYQSAGVWNTFTTIQGIVVATLKFNANGGTVWPDSVIVAQGEAVGALPVPAYSGNTFAGWYTGQNGAGTLYTVATGNITLYAKWLAGTTHATYTLNLNPNGGTVSPTSKTVTSGVAVGAIGELPTPVRSGYTFEGWFTQQNGGGTEYTAVTVATGSVTLYAKWVATAAATYTLTFSAGEGATVSPTSKTVTQGSAVGELPTPTRTGYTFEGWFTQQNGGGTEYTAATVATGSLTLYAKWTSGGATIVVDAQLQASVSVYPNPFSMEVRLEGAEGCTLRVVTSAGAVVHTRKVVSANETIVLGNLPAGAYFFQLEKDGKRAVKIVVSG
jgi:uncharacterized repeat protein (TIGR02543 family)